MTNNISPVTIVGAGLAGFEAAWQLAKRGVPVKLIDMKPQKYSPAHKSPGFAELVCSNSLKAEHLTNASGLLKAELRALDSLILSAAEASRVPAGGALAVDRRLFSDRITEAVKRLRLSSRSTAFNIFRPETAINPYRAIQTPPMTQEGIEAMSATKGVMKEKITQPTAAARIVTTEAFLVIATQPTLSP